MGLRAIVAGAGIGGLATAIALRRAGVEVTVLERAQSLGEVGAGLLIWPNGNRALAALGLGSVPGLPIERLTLRTWQGGHLRETPIAECRLRYGSQPMAINRTDLHSLLMQPVQADLRLGAEVVGVVQDVGQVVVRLRSGERVQGDLLVGADGLRSAVRAALYDGSAPPRYAGCTAWRAVLGEVATGFAAGEGANWWGRGSEFGVLPLADGRIYWFATANAPRGQSDSPRSLRSDLLRRFGGWQEPVGTVIAATDEDSILRNDIFDRPPLRTWTQGRVTLLGDAAHPMTPNAAQGACQALEDAVALGECLQAGNDLAAALAAYERRRLARANRAVKLSRASSAAVQSENRLVCSVRDTAARLLPKSLLMRQLDRQMKAAS